MRVTVSSDGGPVLLERLSPEERHLIEAGVKAAFENVVSCPVAVDSLRATGRAAQRRCRSAIHVDRHGC